MISEMRLFRPFVSEYFTATSKMQRTSDEMKLRNNRRYLCHFSKRTASLKCDYANILFVSLHLKTECSKTCASSVLRRVEEHEREKDIPF